MKPTLLFVLLVFLLSSCYYGGMMRDGDDGYRRGYRSGHCPYCDDDDDQGRRRPNR